MMLSAQSLTLGYKNHTIVESTSFTINPGQITSIIGPNGSGKSTLLKALGGIIKPFTGEVTLDKKCLSQWPSKELARNLTLLPQHPIAPESISVQQLLSHGRYPYQGLFSQSSQQDIDVIEWALDATHMTAFRHREFNTLSGGERQRGWIALALVQQPNVLLLDEPTTYLDIGHQMEILELLTRLNQQHKITIVMVLHDINQASQYSHRLIAMQQGKLIADGQPLDILSSKLITQLFNIEAEIIYRQQNGYSYPFSLPIRTHRQCA